MKLQCGNCGKENDFPDEEFDILHSIGGGSVQFNLTNKKYYCEVCGSEIIS